jgi:hypothetical protein
MCLGVQTAARLVLALAAASGVARAQTPIGGEFQINTFTADRQSYPSASAAGAGFVVVWRSQQDGSDAGIFGRRFNSSANPLASEFQINVRTLADQFQPRVAGSDTGAFVVVWVGYGGGFPLEGSVFARRFDSAGSAVGGEFQVNTYTTDTQKYPAVAISTAGDFTVVWHSRLQDGNSFGVFARTFNSGGTPTAVEFQVATATANDQWYADVAILGSRRFFAFGQGANEAARVRARLRDAAFVGTEVEVFSPGVRRGGSRVATDSTGRGFVVASGANHPTPTAYGVFGSASQVDGGSLAFGSELPISQNTSGNHYGQAVESIDDKFVVTWQSSSDNSSNILLGVVDLDTSSASAPIQVNTYTTGAQTFPDVTAVDADAAGGFVVVWQSTNQDGSSNGVFGRRFSLGTTPVGTPTNTPTPSVTPTPTVPLTPTPTLSPTATRTLRPAVADDIDADGQTDALTDGLLKLRWMFGFSGGTLTTGAVDTQSCTRCSAADISAYLNGSGLTFDIDGDGELVALTDGLLNLRWMFGFRGPTLISGAVDNSDCTRCNADDIETYIEGLN